MKNRVLVLLVFLVAVLPVIPIVAQSVKFLHHLQLENGVHLDYKSDDGLEIRIFTAQPQEFLEKVPHQTLEIESDQLVIRLEKYIPIESTDEMVEGVSLSKMPMQTFRQELRQNVSPVQSAVDTVADWNVNQTVLGR